jgi:hypothetical protein
MQLMLIVCDALNTGFTALLGLHTIGLTTTSLYSWTCFNMVICSLITFYMSTWEEYHTGILYLSECSGPVEGLLTLILVFCITGLKGVYQGFYVFYSHNYGRSRFLESEDVS